MGSVHRNGGAVAPRSNVGARLQVPTDYLAFQVPGDDFAVRLAQVREVSILGPVTRVPGASPAIHGVSNLRGSVVPILDVAARLGRPEAHPSRRTAVVHANAVVGGEPIAVGLMVDSLSGILRISSEDVQHLPAELFVHERDLLEGLACVEGRVVCLLTVNVLVDPCKVRAVVSHPRSMETTDSGIAAALADGNSAGPDGMSTNRPSRKAEMVSAPAGEDPSTGHEATARVVQHRLRPDAESVGGATRKEKVPRRNYDPDVATASRHACASNDRSRIVRTWNVAPVPRRAALAISVGTGGLAPVEGIAPDRADLVAPRRRERAAWLVCIAPVIAVFLFLVVFAVAERQHNDDLHHDARPRARQSSDERLLSLPSIRHVLADSPAVTAAAPLATPTSSYSPDARPPPRRSAPSSDHRAAGARAERSLESIHEVRPGDSLWLLSGRYLGNPVLWPKIFAANRSRIKDPNLISPGQHLCVPVP